VCVPLAWAQKTPSSSGNEKSPSKKETKTEQPEIAYLGVDIESLHPALASHLPDALVNGQGVLVTYVSPDSPAQKAGLKSHDVLTTFDDQKLFAPEQFAKLVQHAKPQQEIALGIVRQGKTQKLNVALGVRPYDPELCSMLGNRA
jgi:serine protease Do